MGKVKLSEWLWRFLATAMLFAVGWTMWIFYQLNPRPLVLNAAFEAAAKAKANANANAGQRVQGVISPPAGSAPATTPVPVPDPVAAPAEPREPPINPDKLKFSDSIATPAPDAKK